MASILGGVTENCGWNCGWDPQPHRTEGEGGQRSPPKSQAHPNPILLCLLLLTVISPDQVTRLSTEHVVSNLLPNLSQSLVKMPGACRARLHRRQDLQDKCQWEEETHTDSRSATPRTATQGSRMAWGCPLDGQGQAQRPSAKQGCHGKSTFLSPRPLFL